MEAHFFEHQAVFRIGKFEVASRLETEKFPAWEEVLPKKSKYELRVSKRSLLEGLDQIAAAIGKRSRGIRLRRVADGLEIHGESPDTGTMTTVIESTGWEEGQMIGVNLGYLYNAARFAPSDELGIGITDENTALLVEDGPYFACVMPARSETEEMKVNKADNRIEDPREVRHCEADPAVLWIDDATGKLVDRSSRPEPQTAPYEMARPGTEIPRLPMRNVRPAFIDLVGPRSPVTMEDGARPERTRLPSRVVRLLPARGGGS